MNSDMINFYNLQRHIFGVCPHSGQIFRLSDCNIFLKNKPVADWMTRLQKAEERLGIYEEKIEEKRDALKEAARAKGRRRANQIIKKIDPVFGPLKLNPDDVKILFHPTDYIVFNGMKSEKPMKNIILLDREAAGPDHKKVQKSIEKTIEKGKYDWLTLRVGEDGKVVEE